MVYETWLKSDLKKPMRVQPLTGNLFSADNNGNLIGVEVLDNGQPAQLTGAVTGYVIRADGATVTVVGELDGNKASIVLPASAYIVVGQVSIVIKVGTVTVGACVSNVYRTNTDSLVDPGHVIPSISELLAEIDNMRTATAAANTATENANTATSNANTAANTANTAANNANAKATLADTAATTANTAAGKIDNMTVAATTSPEGSQASVTITEVNGHKHVAFGIPKGDKGKDFHIAFTFASIAAMEAYSGDIELFDYAMIDTGNVQDADTGKLYCYEQDEEWHYIGDLSGAQGIKGETGTGIDHIALNADYTLTIYYDNGTSDTTPSIRGATGITPNISIGTVTTLLPDQQAYITRDPSSTAENPVFNFGIPKGDTGTLENVYATNVPMSASDSTTVAEAIGSKLNKNQGTANSGKYMKVSSNGELVPENIPEPTGKADKVANATSGNFAGLDANGNLTDSGKKPSDFLSEHQDISGKADKVFNATSGNLAGMNANGNLTDSGIAAEDVATKENLNRTQEGIAIIVDGDTASVAVPVGGYAYVKNNTHGLTEGLYRNNSASAFPTSGGTADSTVFESVSGGGLNALNNNLKGAVRIYCIFRNDDPGNGIGAMTLTDDFSKCLGFFIRMTTQDTNPLQVCGFIRVGEPARRLGTGNYRTFTATTTSLSWTTSSASSYNTQFSIITEVWAVEYVTDFMPPIPPNRGFNKKDW